MSYHNGYTYCVISLDTKLKTITHFEPCSDVFSEIEKPIQRLLDRVASCIDNYISDCSSKGQWKLLWINSDFVIYKQIYKCLGTVVSSVVYPLGCSSDGAIECLNFLLLHSIRPYARLKNNLYMAWSSGVYKKYKRVWEALFNVCRDSLMIEIERELRKCTKCIQAYRFRD